ncbi:MAG: hypothetical protein C5B56_07110 [Proteobacteria bacterium]|nr:MAG: hypothetical protein C5B56_07110 [Pseudomonadota bacterium]
MFENPNEGADTVIASVSYTLDANVETLDLAHGAGEINATGNALNNIIFGNESNNVIDGGAGADMTWGGSGADKFVWNSTSEATTNPYGPVDTIMDFDPAEGDKIDLRGLVNEAGGINNVFIFGFEGNGGLTWDFSVSSNTTHQTLALIEVHNTTALHDLQFWNAVIVA